MAESRLRTLSIDFAVQILNLVKFLKSQHETIVSNQIGRAGTSIGANIHEAQYAHGKPDFIAKNPLSVPTVCSIQKTALLMWAEFPLVDVRFRLLLVPVLLKAWSKLQALQNL